jgi:hypothetical protein
MLQRSSGSIGSLAAALAKAQGELTNPEKSLVATIPANSPGGTEKTFRYASLSSGLDIVRKVLGQHEIATMQTTGIDQAAGIVNLTTVLAHASGEWIASDWPVCAISDTAIPQRMGAALTYARRYALFTLVGIAGEDDLDAPDLTTPTSKAPAREVPRTNGDARLKGRQTGHTGKAIVARASRTSLNATKEIIGTEASAELRDRLIAEIGRLSSGDEAAIWAHQRLVEKGKLHGADAHQVEQSFAAKIATFATHPDDGSNLFESAPHSAAPHADSPKLQNGQQSGSIEKSVLSLSEPRRLRDRDHLKLVSKQPCLVCGRRPCDAHHLRFSQPRALSRKVSDEFTVPLCRGHHRELHRCGDEKRWWEKVGIDPTVAARTLWLRTHPLSVREMVGPAADVGEQDPNLERKPIEKPA